MESKICTRCKIEFPLASFAPRKDRGNRPHSWCTQCRLKSLKRVADNRAKKVRRVQEYKATKGCCICGFAEGVALDLHHLDPSIKEDAISEMFAKHASLDAIFKEIEKCVVICANHHRMLHAGLITL